ncbi:MAG: hypothetical protein J2P21_18415 [Chloracidobacterium sp.]|nr:hypothetical protein [Chloracidobacterium sp.]
MAGHIFFLRGAGEGGDDGLAQTEIGPAPRSAVTPPDSPQSSSCRNGARIGGEPRTPCRSMS